MHTGTHQSGFPVRVRHRACITASNPIYFSALAEPHCIWLENSISPPSHVRRRHHPYHRKRKLAKPEHCMASTSILFADHGVKPNLVHRAKFKPFPSRAPSLRVLSPLRSSSPTTPGAFTDPFLQVTPVQPVPQIKKTVTEKENSQSPSMVWRRQS
jgi:hypothetical protein